MPRLATFEETFTPRRPETLNPLALLWQALQADPVGAGVASPMGAVAGVKAIGPRAQQLLGQALEAFAPAARSQLLKEGLRSGALAVPTRLSPTVDFAIAPRGIFHHLARKSDDPLVHFAKGVQHGPFFPNVRAGVLVAENAPTGSSFFNPVMVGKHELGHTLFAQLRPPTFQRMVKELSDMTTIDNLRQALSGRMHEGGAAADAAEDAMLALDYFAQLIERGTPVAKKVLDEAAEEVFARMVQGTIPPTKMLQRLMARPTK